MGEKFRQLNNWWFKGKPGKTAKLGKGYSRPSNKRSIIYVGK